MTATHPQSPASPLPEAAEPVAKPFGWYGESRFDNDFTTNEDTSRRWHANGYRLTPLYAAPSPVAQAAAQAGEVAPDYSEMSREQLERHAVRMAQLLTNDRAIRFYDKHAFGPLAAPSCLCCGRLPDKVAIKHMELPGIVICQSCRDKALATQPLAAPVQQEAEAVALWQWRFFDTANPPGHWTEWKEVVPRNAYTDTVETKVQELRGYIAAGYKYEVRALYAAREQAPSPLTAALQQAREALAYHQDQTRPIDKTAAAIKAIDAALATPPAHPVLAPVVREPLTATPTQFIAAHTYLRGCEIDMSGAELDNLLRIFGIQATTGEQSHAD